MSTGAAILLLALMAVSFIAGIFVQKNKTVKSTKIVKSTKPSLVVPSFVSKETINDAKKLQEEATALLEKLK